AEADLLAALQLRPDDPGLLNYLAFSWADQGVNLDRARTMLERAIQLVRAARQIEARSQWEKAERLSDDKVLTEQIRTKLKDGLDNVENPPRRASVT